MLAHGQLLTELTDGQLARLVQCRCRNVVLLANPSDHFWAKDLAFGATETFLVQGLGDLLISLLLCQSAHFAYEGFRIAPAVGSFEWQLDHEVFRSTALPA